MKESIQIIHQCKFARELKRNISRTALNIAMNEVVEARQNVTKEAAIDKTTTNQAYAEDSTGLPTTLSDYSSKARPSHIRISDEQVLRVIDKERRHAPNQAQNMQPRRNTTTKEHNPAQPTNPPTEFHLIYRTETPRYAHWRTVLPLSYERQLPNPEVNFNKNPQLDGRRYRQHNTTQRRHPK
ncbi:hypothetical protein BDZ45DRAFT_810368 [Acephala macrosclerotiorum]|nr:hypothetical protein BDZ45DRAFT_810368 [Acephala macrosclerotiorum]